MVVQHGMQGGDVGLGHQEPAACPVAPAGQEAEIPLPVGRRCRPPLPGPVALGPRGDPRIAHGEGHALLKVRLDRHVPAIGAGQVCRAGVREQGAPLFRRARRRRAGHADDAPRAHVRLEGSRQQLDRGALRRHEWRVGLGGIPDGPRVTIPQHRRAGGDLHQRRTPQP